MFEFQDTERKKKIITVIKDYSAKSKISPENEKTDTLTFISKQVPSQLSDARRWILYFYVFLMKEVSFVLLTLPNVKPDFTSKADVSQNADLSLNTC